MLQNNSPQPYSYKVDHRIFEIIFVCLHHYEKMSTFETTTDVWHIIYSSAENNHES